MQATPEPLRANLDFASRFENIELAERCLLDLVATAGLEDPDHEYWILTALRESLANAIRHGNRQDQNLRVRVEYAIEGRCLSIRVTDEGEGFDPSSIPDPTAPENLLRPTGRGIFYINQFMDHVEFRTGPNGGTEVVMRRTIQPVDQKENAP